MKYRKTKLYQQLNAFEACQIAEGFDGLNHSEAEVLTAWQWLIDSGLAWQLQGWYGRNADLLLANNILSPANH